MCRFTSLCWTMSRLLQADDVQVYQSLLDYVRLLQADDEQVYQILCWTMSPSLLQAEDVQVYQSLLDYEAVFFRQMMCRFTRVFAGL